MFYEDLNLKQKALDKIPIGRLTREATFKFNSYAEQPDCDYCNSNRNMKFKIQSRPESHEVQWLAGNVEVYE